MKPQPTLLNLLIAVLIVGSIPEMAFAQTPEFRCSHFHSHLNRNGQERTIYDAPENLRSDTIDVLRYTIDLDMTRMSQNLISGACKVDFNSLMNGVDVLHLDLEGLNVDSVTFSGGQLTFTHNGRDLHIQLPTALNAGQSFQLTVHYGGDPITDTSWGGFYTTASGFAYNIGVGFDADPHSLGRVWFPCFDNFVERSEFIVNVLTNNGRRAYCGGVMTSMETVGQDSLLTQWVLEDHPIPAYLASVAVSNYRHVNNSYETLLGENIPVWLTARPQDTTAMKNSFANLLNCLSGYEDHYGPYRWPRVGFVSVPFSGGAMEHATNIAYPALAINGALTYETLMAHELSHHWWGDLVTCRTREDMWLNEGWATYSEALFREVQYGTQAYKDYMANYHKRALTRTHIEDGGRYPVSGVPHDLTYSSTVYVKGSNMVHNLRGVMGDANFFAACQAYTEAFQFKDASTIDLRDFFQQFTEEDLTSFFADWVFEPGFPEFRIEHQQITPQGSNWTVDLTIRQYQHYSSDYYENVPLEVTVMNNALESETHQVNVVGEWSLVGINSSIEPVFVILNRNQKLNYAVLAEERIVTNTGTANLTFAEFDMSVTNMGGASSIWVRAENHWAPAQLPNLIPFTEFLVSSDRWWNIQSNLPEEAIINGSVRFFGDPSNQNSFFDPTYFTQVASYGLNENNLIILYRPDAQSDWTEWPSISINTQGSTTNWAGRITINGIRPGHYTWAVRTGTVSTEERLNTEEQKLSVNLINPETIVVTSPEGLIRVLDMQGKLIAQKNSKGRIEFTSWLFASGVYVVQCEEQSVKFAVNR